VYAAHRYCSKFYEQIQAGCTSVITGSY